MATIFIFRRDLRLVDNVCLNHIMKNHKNIIPVFIFTPEQIGNKNKYKSDNAIQFMIESLKDLNKELRKYKSKLHLFKGDNIKVLNKICKTTDVENIAFNIDYTPYSIKRDKAIAKLCKKLDINCILKEDYLLAKMDSFLKKDNTPYTIFTPFKNSGLKQKSKINKPAKSQVKNLIKSNKLDTVDYIKHKINKNISVNGGRKEALKQLKKVKNQKKYAKTRNTLEIETTLLSAYIKFGCLSIREVFWYINNKLGSKSVLLSQLFWREFYFYIAYHFPKVLKGKNYNEKYNSIKWKNSKKLFNAWCEGKTGYPVVDAGMRQMNETGYMHNRARLITSNFLNRLLGHDWRKGEQYYATQLVDYDPSVNNGNWQWIASTGVDPKPYFQRLFNPMTQSKKYDSDCNYIRKWVPELKDVPDKDIHDWNTKYVDYDLKKVKYVKPIVEYKEARNDSVMMYRKVLKKRKK